MSTLQEHARLMHLASVAALAVAVRLSLAKAIAWWLSGGVLPQRSPTHLARPQFYKNKLENFAKVKLKAWRYLLYDRASAGLGRGL
ncbi:hypothetical protein [Azotobacter armeniacus]